MWLSHFDPNLPLLSTGNFELKMSKVLIHKLKTFVHLKAKIILDSHDTFLTISCC